EALERAHAVNVVVLDKTGTITTGKPALTDVVPADGHYTDEVLKYIASAEQGSEHPLAEAIVAGAAERKMMLLPPTEFRSVTGQGISATIDGHEVLAGNARLLEQKGIAMNGLPQKAEKLAEAGKTPMFLAVDGKATGLVAVADTIKSSSVAAIQTLREMGIHVAMITGDN